MNSLKKSSGFSLVELLTSMGIASIVAMGTISMLTFLFGQYSELIEKNRVHQQMFNFGVVMRNYLSQALDLDVVPSAGNTNLPAFGSAISTGILPRGQIIQRYDLDAAAANAGASAVLYRGPSGDQVDTLAVFNREWGIVKDPGHADYNKSRILWTRIFFQRPLVGASASGGSIFVDPGGGVLANPSSGVTFDNISNLRIDVEAMNGRAKFARINLTMRYFTQHSDQNWCTTSVINSCPSSGYREVNEEFLIGFRNNVLLDNPIVGGDGAERLYGNLYFFKLERPQIR